MNFGHPLFRQSVFASLLLLLFAATSDAAPVAFPVNEQTVQIGWAISFGGAVLALIFAYRFFRWMTRQDEGDPLMIQIAENVRAGARAYLNRQYKVVVLFFALTSLVLAVVAYGFDAQSEWVPFAFLTGGLFSGLAGWFGMRTATLASSRTTAAARNSLNEGLQVAFRSGAVMGLVVVGLALLDISFWFAVLYWMVGMPLTEITVTMLCFGMGASAQALFARVGGGIFTKAADVGADLVGKVEAGIPEDDPRNPATIADNVGDNVGDVAGMGADLYESYAGSILASAALGVAAYQGFPQMQMLLLLLPLLLAAAGIVASIAGIFFVKTEEGASQRNLLDALDKGIKLSSLGVIVLAAALVYFLLVIPSTGEELSLALSERALPHGFGMFGVFGSIVTGLVAGIVIGKWTEYSTSEEYAPTRRIADQGTTGPATVIIAGISEGFLSVWVPIVVIGISIMLAFGFSSGFDFKDTGVFAMGLYGVAIAAVGMLSTLGITLATDAYGPIADNAGGNAQMSGQDPQVRERTDALDSLGNTTAATGKGFAIGSAALTALALLAAYVEEVRLGFTHWVEAIENVPVSKSYQSATVHVVAQDVLAVHLEGAEHPEAWLLYPTIGAKPPAVMQTLREAEAGADLRDIDLQHLADEGLLIKNLSATIPDFARYYNVTLVNPKVLVGLFMGVMLAFVFCALTMKAVGNAAGAMVEEVRRQFRDIPGIMEGTGQPDYASCVAISTSSALRQMVLPSILGLVVPIAVGLVLGVGGVIGMLAGGLTSGFAVAVMMSNSGGSWDNAKKYIEAGAHGGKGTDAHAATVVGDTVGDPFKDMSGPSLNILIKLMSMVSVVFAGMIVRYALTIF